MRRILWRGAAVLVVILGGMWFGQGAADVAGSRTLTQPASTLMAMQPLDPSPPTQDSATSERVAYWLERGIRLEGAWQPERIKLVVGVLDRYADRLGELRFVELVHQAVEAGTAGQAHDLTITMDPSTDYWVASWTPERGQIALSESLFDPAHMEANYRWRYLDRLREAEPEPISAQAFAVAHELGHLLLDGMREEHIEKGLAPTVLEDLYAETLIVEYWPKPFTGANESLADEIGLWAFGIRRPAAVRSYHEGALEPALMGDSQRRTDL